ncbi:MAG: hypothetical protein AB1571_00980 [Nanoarchaeota archaeon]
MGLENKLTENRSGLLSRINNYLKSSLTAKVIAYSLAGSLAFGTGYSIFNGCGDERIEIKCQSDSDCNDISGNYYTCRNGTCVSTSCFNLEICDGIDNDCDGKIDEETCYLKCDDAINLISEISYNGTTVGARSDVNNYNCESDRDETGPERVHKITIDSAKTIIASLDNFYSTDFDIFILSDCNKDKCIAFGGWDEAVYFSARPGTYYIVIDGYLGDSGNYTLTISTK